MSNGVLAVVVPPELARGFQLAGVTTIVAAEAGEAEREMSRLMMDAQQGVVAVYEPFLNAFDHDVRTRAETSLTPVTVPLAAGPGEVDPHLRRARLSELLSRAVGYHITFEPEGAQ